MQIKIAQKPANLTDAPVVDKPHQPMSNLNADDRSMPAPDIDMAQQDNPVVNDQLVQQRVAPAADAQVTNDVKKSRTEERESLVNKTEIAVVPLNQKADSSELAQQTEKDIPAHIKELLQNTHASDQKLNGMPPQEVLQAWQKSQWIEQVKVLNKQGKRDLAERYVQAYPDYFPNDSINYLLPSRP